MTKEKVCEVYGVRHLYDTETNQCLRCGVSMPTAPEPAQPTSNELLLDRLEDAVRADNEALHSWNGHKRDKIIAKQSERAAAHAAVIAAMRAAHEPCEHCECPELHEDRASQPSEARHTVVMTCQACGAAAVGFAQPPDATQYASALEKALNPRFWSSAQSAAWHRNIPDVQAAFDALRAMVTKEGSHE